MKNYCPCCKFYFGSLKSGKCPDCKVPLTWGPPRLLVFPGNAEVRHGAKDADLD